MNRLISLATGTITAVAIRTIAVADWWLTRQGLGLDTTPSYVPTWLEEVVERAGH